MRSSIILFIFCFSFISFGENTTDLLVGVDVSVSVYPNPASDYLILTPKKQYSGLVFKIYNSVGLEMHSDELDAVKKIDLSDFKSNIYIVNFYLYGECVKTERLIVRH